MYLAGAGVNLKLVDFDDVEVSNLHRQILHSDASVGSSKVFSAVANVQKLNPNVLVEGFHERFSSINAMSLVSSVDVVIDATDDIETRYLINDACVLSGKALVSGSAIGLEGQLTVHFPPSGPCYRCLHPHPGALRSCGSCANEGVFGPVPGVIGCLQAVEAIKAILFLKQGFALDPNSSLLGRQLFYDAWSAQTHLFTLPARNPYCLVCSSSSEDRVILDMESSQANLSRELTAASQIVVELPADARISAKEYASVMLSEVVPPLPHILLDVRSETQFGIASLVPPSSRCITVMNVPLLSLRGGVDASTRSHKASEQLQAILAPSLPIYVICRRGIDSVAATKLLLDHGVPSVFNINGGLEEWRSNVDASFALY